DLQSWCVLGCRYPARGRSRRNYGLGSATRRARAVWPGSADACEMGAAEDVLAGALGDRERAVDVAAVHILLDDREDLGVDLGNRLDDGGEVGDAVRRLDHDSLGDGLGEWHVILQHVEEQTGIHLLEV